MSGFGNTPAPGEEYAVERLKDLATEMNFTRLSATRRYTADRWRTVTVEHAALMSDSPDGWDVTYEDGEI